MYNITLWCVHVTTVAKENTVSIKYYQCLSVLSLSYPACKLHLFCIILYSVIQKDGLNFVRLYFLNCTWYLNDLQNI